MSRKAERAPWGNFPAVIRNGMLGEIEKEPEYQAAKAGDTDAAFELIDRMLTEETVTQVKSIIGDRKPKILPVLAVENSGNNKIPLAIACVLAYRLDLDVETDVCQAEKIGRTQGDANYRLTFSPTFDGSIEPEMDYFIVDDTLTQGGTIASLRGFVENRGGHVLGAMVMTSKQYSLPLAITPDMVQDVLENLGNEVDSYWRENFEYGITELTQSEGRTLGAAASLDEVRDRITEARHARESRAHVAESPEAQANTAEPGAGDGTLILSMSNTELINRCHAWIVAKRQEKEAKLGNTPTAKELDQKRDLDM